MLSATVASAGRGQITASEGPRFGLNRGLLRLLLLVGVAILLPTSANAERWSRRYVDALPDSAFAAVERAADGHRLRHLPHHDRYGHIDIPHLRNALTRVTQVHWVDPRRAAAARAHLLRHLHALRTHRFSDP